MCQKKNLQEKNIFKITFENVIENDENVIENDL